MVGQQQPKARARARRAQNAARTLPVVLGETVDDLCASEADGPDPSPQVEESKANTPCIQASPMEEESSRLDLVREDSGTELARTCSAIAVEQQRTIPEGTAVVGSQNGSGNLGSQTTRCTDVDRPASPSTAPSQPATPYHVRIPAKVRAAYSRDSTVLGVLKPGTIINVLEVRSDEQRQQRVRIIDHSGREGWLSVESATGHVILELMSDAELQQLQQLHRAAGIGDCWENKVLYDR